ncbi:MAG: hypothetical protein J6R66_03065 [Clostridia bacterium]|nr:hypothetical protein [Clostridia bacterium]
MDIRSINAINAGGFSLLFGGVKPGGMKNQFIIRETTGVSKKLYGMNA